MAEKEVEKEEEKEKTEEKLTAPDDTEDLETMPVKVNNFAAACS